MSKLQPPAHPAPAPGPRALAVVLPVAALVAVIGSAADGAWTDGRAPAPYAWADVAVVHLVCALPLALMLAAVLVPRVATVGIVAVAAGCFAVGLAPLVGDVAAESASVLRSEPGLGLVLRSAPALALAAGAVIVVMVRAGGHGRPGGTWPGWRRAAVFGALGTAALLVPPATYTDARCRHDLGRLGEYLEQSRVGEARALAHGLIVLDGGLTFHGRPLSEVAGALNRAAASLEARVASPLRPHATTRERLDRARALAMLGRTDEALDALRPVSDPGAVPEVEALRGTIHETRGEWEPGLSAYREAGASWERRGPSAARDAGVLRARIGVAYCLRKSGRYAEAEAAYREVLALSPTADSHFLLAQFYEDAQRAGSAREHARRAIELAPDRYGTAGARLIEKLAVFQFGCLGVYDSER
ncbi:MAG: tetratricopeptide repeat protein [Planctomycetes bacterium]|nr:tetratricopeptide repeat protein [Planctomycetota bacterium]